MKNSLKKTGRITIIQLLKNKECSPSDIQQKLGISLPLIHRYLNEFVSGGYVEKTGTPPTVLYSLIHNPSAVRSPLIEKHFVFLDSRGKMSYGMQGFLLWSTHALKRQSLYEKVLLYEDRIRSLEATRKKHVAFSLQKKIKMMVQETDTQMFLKEAVSAFPYALPDFGRTKQAIFLDIAKDGAVRSRKFADSLIDDFIPTLFAYIERHTIDAVMIIPPSAQRRVQIIKILSERFASHFPDIPIIPIEKKTGDVIIQQKHLNTARERIENVDATFFVPASEKQYDRLLLIDDMVGSGATLNGVAKKVVEQDISKEIYGISIVGDEKGFTTVRKT